MVSSKKTNGQPLANARQRGEVPASTDHGASSNHGGTGDRTTAAAWLRQSPSWLTSMLVHMILLVVLGLWAMPQNMKEDFKEIMLGPPDMPENEELDDENPDKPTEDPPIIEPLPTDEKLNEVTALVDFKIESASVTVPNNAAGMQLAARIELSNLAIDSIAIGDLGVLTTGTGPTGFGDRSPIGRKRIGGRRGGGPKADQAVEEALKWLARHQNYDGSWSWMHTPGDGCSGFANPGARKSTMGATGMALLPFLGAGYTHVKGKYQDTVHRGIQYLVRNRSKDGRLVIDPKAREHMYVHGIAACALAEAYGMTQDSSLFEPAQASLNYIVLAQDPTTGGWAYQPRGGGDTSVVGWQVMALKSGVLSRLTIPGSAKKGAVRWLDYVQAAMPPDGYGIGSNYGYRSPAANRAACTAIGLLCRNYLGTPKDDPGLRMGVEWIAKRGPNVSRDFAQSRANMYYNYYGSQVMFQNDGPDGPLWKAWNTKMKEYLIASQVKKGSDQGSWYHNGSHSKAGGRLYDTALSAMTLQVYYRYMLIYHQENVAMDDFPLE